MLGGYVRDTWPEPERYQDKIWEFDLDEKWWVVGNLKKVRKKISSSSGKELKFVHGGSAVMINNSIFYFGGEYEEEEGSDDFESPIQRIDLENETIVEDGVEVIGNHDFRSF